jgi:hypothetical protein
MVIKPTFTGCSSLNCLKRVRGCPMMYRDADHEELHERQQRLQRLTLSGPVMQEYRGNGLDARVIAVDALYFKGGLASVCVFDFLLDVAGRGRAFGTLGERLGAVCVPAIIMPLSCKSCSCRLFHSLPSALRRLHEFWCTFVTLLCDNRLSERIAAFTTCPKSKMHMP